MNFAQNDNVKISALRCLVVNAIYRNNNNNKKLLFWGSKWAKVCIFGQNRMSNTLIGSAADLLWIIYTQGHFVFFGLAHGKKKKLKIHEDAAFQVILIKTDWVGKYAASTTATMVKETNSPIKRHLSTPANTCKLHLLPKDKLPLRQVTSGWILISLANGRFWSNNKKDVS